LRSVATCAARRVRPRWCGAVVCRGKVLLLVVWVLLLVLEVVAVLVLVVVQKKKEEEEETEEKEAGRSISSVRPLYKMGGGGVDMAREELRAAQLRLAPAKDRAS
jgi:hypothetical protein